MSTIREQGQLITHDAWGIWQAGGHGFLWFIALLLILGGLFALAWKHGSTWLQARKLERADTSAIESERLRRWENEAKHITDLRTATIDEMRQELSLLRTEVRACRDSELEKERRLVRAEGRIETLEEKVRRQDEELTGLRRVKEFLRHEAVAREAGP